MKLKNLFILLSIFLLISCGKNNQSVRMTDFALGTVCSITLFDETKEDLLAEAFQLMDRYENLISKNISASEISDLNRNAGIESVKVSPEVFDLLELAYEYAEISGGLFDVTIGNIVEMWGIGTEHACVPEPDMLEEAVSKVGYKKLILDKDNRTAYLAEKGLSVDLGGIAKGYIGDKVCEFLKSRQISGGIIDLGGNIIVFGNKPDKSDFKIGIQNPALTRGDYVGIVSIDSGTVVTSGIYERFFEAEGKHYHHIFNSKTGYPVDNELAGVSIVTQISAVGDALSTTVFAMGLEKGMEFIEGLKGTEAIFITKDGQITATSGLGEKWQVRE